MLRVSLLLSCFGLALNVLLWSVPALVAGSALPGVIFPDSAPALSEALASAEHSAGPVTGVPDALVQLVGAEAEAMTVAGQALQHPDQPDLGPRANHASARVLESVQAYIRSVAAALNRPSGR